MDIDTLIYKHCEVFSVYNIYPCILKAGGSR
jgi:hypothetical protein